jgi:L-threonylcarbamoyladenylate synthase
VESEPGDLGVTRDQYRRAIAILQRGGVVAAPTDTVYGLIAVAADMAAVERIYELKQRDPAQPMPLFCGSLEQAELIAEMNDAARALAARFWPGALTIVVAKKSSYETRAVAGGDTAGVRVPDDPFLREAALQLGPLTGTSANIAGWEECHTAAEVRAQLGDAADLVLDAPARTTLRVLAKNPSQEDMQELVDALNADRERHLNARPSTIVDCTIDPPRIVRHGAIPEEEMRAALRR